jgi:hypothetical protein
MKFTKIIFSISILVLFCLSANAQRFNGGAHIGLLATQVDGDSWGGYKKPGLFVGAFSNLSFDEKQIKFQLEMNYAQKGSRNPSSAAFRYRIALHQVEVPFLFGWNGWKNFPLEIGPSFNILASAKEFYDNEEVPSNAGGSSFYFFELGGIVGINYRIKEHLGISLRMNYSLTPIGKGALLKQGRKLGDYLWNNAMLFRFYYQF